MVSDAQSLIALQNPWQRIEDAIGQAAALYPDERFRAWASEKAWTDTSSAYAAETAVPGVMRVGAEKQYGEWLNAAQRWTRVEELIRWAAAAAALAARENAVAEREQAAGHPAIYYRALASALADLSLLFSQIAKDNRQAH